MHYVYALQSIKDNNWLYIGYSSDLKRRFDEHTKGKVRSTRLRMPLKLVYYEAYLAEKDARRREYQLKQHRAKDDLKKLIEHSLNKS